MVWRLSHAPAAYFVTGCRSSITEPPALEARRPDRTKRPESAVSICSRRTALRWTLPPRRSFSGTLLQRNGTPSVSVGVKSPDRLNPHARVNP